MAFDETEHPIYEHTLAQQPLHRSLKIYSFGRSSIAYHYYMNSVCPGSMLSSQREQVLKEIMHFI